MPFIGRRNSHCLFRFFPNPCQPFRSSTAFPLLYIEGTAQRHIERGLRWHKDDCRFSTGPGYAESILQQLTGNSPASGSWVRCHTYHIIHRHTVPPKVQCIRPQMQIRRNVLVFFRHHYIIHMTRPGKIPLKKWLIRLFKTIGPQRFNRLTVCFRRSSKLHLASPLLTFPYLPRVPANTTLYFSAK